MTRELERAYLPQSAPGTRSAGTGRVRDIAVLIVAYRSPELLAECLRSVVQHLPSVPVHVWDNSGPGYPGIDAVVSEFPFVTWHLGASNIGFAAAVNALAETVPECDLLLLNPDAIVRGPLSATRTAIRQPGVAAAAPLVVEVSSTESHRPWDVAHDSPSLVRALVAKAGYAEKLRGTRWSDLYAARPHDVAGYLTGACLAIGRDAWNAVGPFDEEFFLYGEEADWQARARRAGWVLRLADEDGIAHTGHGTVSGNTVAQSRSLDLLRANIALNLELVQGVHTADAYLAGSSALDRLQRSNVRRRRERRALSSASDLPTIIITTNRLVYGGAERQHVLLATELDRRGYEVVIVCMQRFGPLIAEIPHRIRVVRQPWWAPAIDVNRRSAVVISGDTNTETGFATLWSRLGRRRGWLVAAHIPPKPNEPTYSRALAAAMGRADGFIALSPQHWSELDATQKIDTTNYVAPNGVESDHALEQVPMRPKPGAVPHLVMLSRIVEHKNPHLLVEALDGLRHLPWTLSIFGDGPDRERLESLTPESLRDRVHWRGWSAGPDAALSECDLLCVPSRSEAFPLVVLEAMARRIPVIASSVCAVPDMLDDGNAGYLVDDISVAGWRKALEKALTESGAWGEVGNRGFDRMRSQYTIEAMADAYEAAIEAVVR